MEEKSDGLPFLLACGFEAGPETMTFETSVEGFARVTRAVCERLQKRGKIPAGASTIPLSEGPREEVCRLILDHLGFSSEHVAERLRGTEHGFSQTLSRVALLDGKVTGALLVTYQNAFATVEATAVLPQHRHTWVNALLKHSTAEGAIARGVKKVRFSANAAEHRDTTRVAARTGARILKVVRAASLKLERKKFEALAGE